MIDNQALKRISEAKEIANNNDPATVKAKVTPITKPNILLKKPSPEPPTASNKQVLKVKIAPKVPKGQSQRSLLPKALPTITSGKEPKSQPNTGTSNGESKDKSALEIASEFATKCLQGLAPLSKPTSADGLVMPGKRTTARKLKEIEEAKSAKSLVKVEPHDSTNFTDDGKIQTYFLPDGWKKILSRRGSTVSGPLRGFDVYLVAPVPYKKLRSNVDIHKFMSTHPGVPLNPDFVNMEKPIDQTGRTSGKTPSTMKLRQVIRNWTFIKTNSHKKT